MANYCDEKCQKADWSRHESICKQQQKDSKRQPNKSKLPLTWAQLQRYGQSPATGETLEIRATEQVSYPRQVFMCQDRVGAMGTVAAYTDAEVIP